MRQKVNFSTLKNSKKLLEDVEKLEKSEDKKYDRIIKKVSKGELLVVGEKDIASKEKGLDEEFTYCTLGAAIDLDRILTGKALPSWKALGSILFHLATNQEFRPDLAEEEKSYLGHADSPDGVMHVWLIYRPRIGWLKSPEAALTLSGAREVAERAPDDRHVVFAPARHVSRKMLNDNALPVEFVPLPFALYRLERS